ncbi:MAG TPA: hypothetical protein DD417_12195 [Elusimicrobia bacterium]|nr:MAG: hypothetical protein A2X53_11750 [Candidatus Rokubacteria bacterium GWA2_70_23]HBL17469.1 hypothetical protein [Elusimicrobiota bacterium]
MPERLLPTEQEVRSWLRERRNWGRWGKDDQVGALNLVTPARRAAAARLVRSGRSVSLSRPFPKEPGPNNALPAQHYIPWAVHAVLFAYGVALLDNALLEPLATACVEEGRDEFMLVIAPLRVVGGTGSPANPLAVF